MALSEAIDVEINGLIKTSIDQARALAAKETGTVNVVVDGVTVKHVIPKKVEWDQAKLKSKWDEIKKEGDDPTAYIKKKETFTVGEKEFETFAPEVKIFFSDARTVSYGTPQITFEVKE